MISGSIDKLTPKGAVGWIYQANSESPSLLRAFLNGEVIGETVADLYRPDLHQVGLGDGHCGFEMSFGRALTESQLPFVKIKPEKIDLSLSLTEKTIYLDLLHALMRNAEGAGRTRSVLGGFWTDRTDAAQVLAGRIAVGSCPAELQPMLQELILNGYVVLPSVLAPKGLQAKDGTALVSIEQRAKATVATIKDVLDSMAKLLFRDSTVRLMRNIFDDHPIIYRLDRLKEETGFHQAASVEALPSPAESLLIYAAFPGASVRLDIIRDSHEMGEFGPAGFSRWTADGARELGAMAEKQGLSIEEVEFNNLDLVIVGPGLVHRVVASEESAVLRALAVPRRVTPLKYLSGAQSWVEATHVSGAKVRV
ncbi:hypothetical protein ACELLULO517_00885 [Acidisoma cellulosilytica]|uniref:Uncharacterized protein n=1 Tax=Acidisoma cellulosilyticum TaxID=2802395 RepID=A0A963YXF2_9PROT|nr:hypothetical protein [Acidisoma cellulosilyticum]MCB8878771.1 hypothetical protein [Acidisoma cellulosilyticum]